MRRSAAVVPYAGRRIGRYRPIEAIGTIGAAAYKRVRASIDSASKRVANEERPRSEPLTTAADVRVDYRSRRRRLSPRARRSVKKFSKRVLRVTDKLQSPVKVVMNGSNTAASTAGAQGVIIDGSMFLNTLSNSIAGERDMLNISNGLGDVATSTTQIRCRSALLEVALLNNGTTPVWVEVYTVKARRVVSGTANSLLTQYTLGFTNEPAALTGGTSMVPTSYGASPFLNRMFTEDWKILKKETICLNGGNGTNLTLRARPRWVTNRDQFSGNSIKVGDQFTKGFIFQFYGSPNASSGPPVVAGLSWNAIKTYVVENLRSSGLPNSLQTLAL